MHLIPSFKKKLTHTRRVVIVGWVVPLFWVKERQIWLQSSHCITKDIALSALTGNSTSWLSFARITTSQTIFYHFLISRLDLALLPWYFNRHTVDFSHNGNRNEVQVCNFLLSHRGKKFRQILVFLPKTDFHYIWRSWCLYYYLFNIKH